ncbi:prephenate dehydratase [Azospirillum melinis]|uniref:prephenate dehydratase n=1 Tax=Azospirillum melinis TaxID=328839 RepID=UPI003757CCA6
MGTSNIIAFQGFPGAYSDLACRNARPTMMTMPCATFEDAFSAVRDGRASLAMIPVENSIAGRVADNHYLLPEGGLHIIGEHFQRVNHQLLAPKGATLDSIQTVRSHIQALSQCQTAIRGLGLQAINHADTAGAAKEIAAMNDPRHAAIASSLAAEIYGLDILKSGIEDATHNTTRFLILAREPKLPAQGSCKTITTFVFRVRSVPAALYKALGGFATNGINMTKLESYMVGGHFTQTQFYADVEGHPDERPLRLALEELDFFAREVKILGVYPANPFRYQESQRVGED